jgi:hypothetical protein
MRTTKFPKTGLSLAQPDSPSGEAMVKVAIEVAPSDLDVIRMFGNGDLVEGLHRAAQLVRGKMIGDALAGTVNAPT